MHSSSTSPLAFAAAIFAAIFTASCALPEGDRGDPGKPGLMGSAGDVGKTGVRGAQGEKGEPGDPGQAGPAGATCSADDVAQLLASSPQFRAQLVEMLVAGHGEALRGPQGERGAVGESGLQGEPGERGEQGAAGMSAQQLYAFNGHGDAIGWVTSVDDSGYIIYIEQDDVFYRIPTGLGGWGVRNVRIYYDSLNCTGTPYINEPPRRLTNVDGSGFYRTTNVGWQVMIPQSTLSPDGICGPGSGGMEIYVTMAEQVQRPDYLIGPFTIGR